MPLASIATGLLFGSLALLLPKARRIYVAIAVSLVAVVAAFWSIAASEQPIELGMVSGILVLVVVLAIGPFVAAFALVQALRRYIAIWQKVRGISRSDRQ